ncbi:MAG TPA: hypothetical protein VK364_09755 [Hymenobacter sp.]|nr:hypothetical protein [Hymenobacter sp.]
MGDPVLCNPTIGKNRKTAFNKIAEEMTAQSVKLLATLKNEGHYFMMEGERLHVLAKSATTP